MEYDIVSAGDYKIVIEKIRKKIAEGWEPLGGVSISESETSEDYYFSVAQAIIKKDFKKMR